MSKLGQNLGRSNYHLQQIVYRTSKQIRQHIYLFAYKLDTPVVKSLIEMFKRNQYNYHAQQIGTLGQIQLKPQKKTICLFQLSQQKKDANSIVPTIDSNQNLSVITYGNNKKGTNYKNYKNQKQLQQYLYQYFLQQRLNNKIRLSGVHSIKSVEKNKSLSKSTLNKVFTDNKYGKVYYYNNFKDQSGKISNYQIFAQSLQRQNNNFRSFMNPNELQKVQQLKDNKKYLVLLPSNDKSSALIKQIQKISKKNFDFVLLGDLNPKKQLLAKNVILATNLPHKIIYFMINNGFQSEYLRLLFEKYQREYKNSEDYNHYNLDYENNNYNIQVNSMNLEQNQGISKAAGSNLYVQNGGQKKKIIKKIKSPPKQNKINQQQTHLLQYRQGNTLNYNNLSNNLNYNNSTFKNTQATNSIEHNMLRQSNVNINISNQSQQFTNSLAGKNISNIGSNVSTKKIQLKNQPVQYANNHQYSNTNTFISKYNIIPSAVIHQNSQEYRGSNKESIVMLQPELSNRSMKHNINNGNISYIKYGSNIQPQEQKFDKKIVTKSFVGHNPQRQYIHISQNSIQQPITATHINNPYRSVYQSSVPAVQYISSNYNDIYKSPRKISNDQKSDLPKIVSPYSPQKIAANPINVYSSSYNTSTKNNYNGNTLNLNSNSSSTSGGIYQIGGTSQVYGTKTYGVNQQNGTSQRYNSPSKVTIKKNNLSPQIININEQSKRTIFNQSSQNRITFAGKNQNISPFVKNYHTQTYSSSKSISNNNPSSSYYNVQTLNYNDLNKLPNNKIQISSTKPEIITSTKKSTDNNVSSHKYQIKTYGTSNATSNASNYTVNPAKNINNYQSKTITSSSNNNKFSNDGINWSEYEKIQRDGVTVFKKKGTSNSPTITSNFYEVNNNKMRQSNRSSQSPKVQRYQVSPLRDKGYNNTLKNGVTYTTTTTTTNNRNNPNQIRYQSPSSRNYESYYTSYAVKPSQYENMIESSIKKNKQDNNKYQTVSYTTTQRKQTFNPGNGIHGTRTYGIQYQPVRVTRAQVYSPRVQANNVQNKNYQKSQIFIKPSQSSISAISDGSIFTKNNIKFGVKPKKTVKKQSICVNNNKIMNGMLNMKDLNKKMALNRVIRGQQYLQQQIIEYKHIETKFNNIHFIVLDDMFYITNILKYYIMTQNDKIQIVSGIDELFNCLKEDNITQIDIGYIFIRKQYLKYINIDLIPQDYYFIFIEPQSKSQLNLISSQKGQQKLEISQINKQIIINNMKYLELSLKIIIDNKLYQYIVYNSKDESMSHIINKFINTQFIIQPLQTQLSLDVLDCYFCQEPRLTRAYLLCHQHELSKILRIRQNYKKINNNFQTQACKIICLIDENQNKQQLIDIYKTKDILFVQYTQNIRDCRQILVNQAQISDHQDNILPHNIIFIHNYHKKITKQLEDMYPGRFQYRFFDKISQVNQCISKRSNNKNEQFYMILSEHCKNEKINVQKFKTVYMLGKVKMVQNKIIRVMNIVQLLQLLKK